MRSALLSIFFLLISIGLASAQVNDFSYSINLDSFPKIELDCKLRNPAKLTKAEFELIENENSINFNFEHLPPKVEKQAPKNVLILVENLRRPERLKFYRKALLDAIPDIVNPGDKYNIAVFDRVRNNGTTTVFPILNRYTDSKTILKSAIRRIKPVDDIFGNNKSSDLYHAIYDGLEDLNNNFSQDKYLIVLSSTFNNKWSGHNSFVPSKQFALEHNIPVYSIQYLIPGGEAHKLTALCSESYGDEYITKSPFLASSSLKQFVNNASSKSLGQNYKFTYTSTLPPDDNIYNSILSIKGKKQKIDSLIPQKSFIDKLWEEYLVFTLLALLFTFFLLAYLITMLMNTKKQTLETSKKIEGVKNQNNKVSSLIRNQATELNKLKQENLKRSQAERAMGSIGMLKKRMKVLQRFASLDVKINGELRHFFINKTKVKIGRSLKNDLLLNNSTVSREHAEIYFNNDQYYIKDINSTPGTIVNGKKIIGSPIYHNDTIQLGEVILTFIR